MKPKTKIALTLCAIVAANVGEKYETIEIVSPWIYNGADMAIYFKDSPMYFYRKINPLPELEWVSVSFDPTVKSPTASFLIGEYKFCLCFKGRPHQSAMYPTRIRRASLSWNNLEIFPFFNYIENYPIVEICFNNI